MGAFGLMWTTQGISAIEAEPWLLWNLRKSSSEQNMQALERLVTMSLKIFGRADAFEGDISSRHFALLVACSILLR